MTAIFDAAAFVRPVQRRRIADDLLIGVPVAIAAAAVAWRLAGVVGAAVAMVVVLGCLTALAVHRSRRFDRRWLVRRLDAARPDLDDSADLLFADAHALSPLARLQRGRVERRLAATPPDLRQQWSSRTIAAGWLAAAIVVAAAIAWPTHPSVAALGTTNEGVPAAPGVPLLVGQRLRIVPPAYTGLPPRDASSLDISAPQGSRLEWTLAFAPEPRAADLVFSTGVRLPLTRDKERWTARGILDRSSLYRVLPQSTGGVLPRLHRLDAIADKPPEVKVLAPDRSPGGVTPGQHSWALSFVASDDYGVAPTAQLHLTVAEGEGESVKFRESVVNLHGTGNATARRFNTTVDFAALKFVAGSDLVAQLVVADNRAPAPQAGRSTSVILRWPASTGDGVAMEGIVTRALPAYFRSERQIIIDAEALLKQRPRLAKDVFLEKSDVIGADQRLLRLRYGKFLGEEQEGKAPPPPTADADTNATTAAATPAGDGGGKGAPSRFGNEGDALESYGHVHDESEAATLLDPDTRTALKGALDAMWQAELNLRQGQPAAALPFAYTALGLIKKVQQATRLYVAKVGTDLPIVDETRRLTGKRDGLEHRDLPPLGGAPSDPVPVAIWQALAAPGDVEPRQLAALETWLQGRPSAVTDPLAFAAAIDAVRRDAECGSCRETLRGLLWSVQVRPTGRIRPREAGDDVGHRYLQALRPAR